MKQYNEIGLEEKKEIATVQDVLDNDDFTDGEIIEDEEDAGLVKLNKIRHSYETDKLVVEQPKSMKVMTASEKKDLPEWMQCVACCDEPKSTVIVSCKHAVYCLKCDNQYNLKHHLKKECPICRKEYKKTMPVFFS